MSWQAYVDVNLVGSGYLRHAAILSLPDGEPLAASADIGLSADEGACCKLFRPRLKLHVSEYPVCATTACLSLVTPSYRRFSDHSFFCGQEGNVTRRCAVCRREGGTNSACFRPVFIVPRVARSNGRVQVRDSVRPFFPDFARTCAGGRGGGRAHLMGPKRESRTGQTRCGLKTSPLFALHASVACVAFFGRST